MRVLHVDHIPDSNAESTGQGKNLRRCKVASAGRPRNGCGNRAIGASRKQQVTYRGRPENLGAGQALMTENDGENKQSPTSSAMYQWPGTPGHGYAGNTMRVGRFTPLLRGIRDGLRLVTGLFRGRSHVTVRSLQRSVAAGGSH